ncbi:MAG: prolyl oligopeptidase family serine peptidase [Luteolibacter sp.]
MFRPILFLRAFGLAWSLLVCPLALLLLVSCVTVQGAVFGVGSLLLGIAPSLVLIGARRHPRLRRAGWICFVCWLLVALGLAIVSPNGRSRSDARVRNCYVGGSEAYQRLALGALLPEVDQFMLGFKLVTVVDSLFTAKQASSLSVLTKKIYADLESDADFHALGSVMPDAYDELWGRKFDRGHYFLYVPPRLDRRRPAPALVFLHGSGGNFKAYTWLLSRVADECGMVLICPSYGMGNWESPGGIQAVAAALGDAGKSLPLDLNQVHLAGLSNGGLGVSRVAASDFGKRFRSLIFLSAVCDGAAIATSNFADQWRDKPVLIITGAADDRVPLRYVSGYASRMRNSGARIEMNTYESADHFLFFSHRDRCLEQLSSWLKQHSDSPPLSSRD